MKYYSVYIALKNENGEVVLETVTQIFADSTKEAFQSALLFVNQDHPNVTIIVKRIEE